MENFLQKNIGCEFSNSNLFIMFRYQEESQTLDEFGVALVIDKKTAKENKRKKQNRCTITPLKV